MPLSIPVKIAIAATVLATSITIAFIQLKPEPLPGIGMPCEIRCDKGHTHPTSWDRVWALPPDQRRVDMGPDGKASVQCPTCTQWAHVFDLKKSP